MKKELLKKEVTINAEQELYVIPSGYGFSCLGFEVCVNRAKKLAAELGESFNAETGTMEAYNEYERLTAIAAKKNWQTGWRSNSELIPEFIGHEGERVEVITKGGEKLRYYIGKSTGFIPIHLMIMKSNSSGGGGVYGYPFQQITFLGKRR